MKPTKGIYFQESMATPADLLREIVDPARKKLQPLPDKMVRALRRHQVTRLQDNVRYLRKKQGEFNRKIEEYIGNIQALVAGIERSLSSAAAPSPAPRPPSADAGPAETGAGSSPPDEGEPVAAEAPGGTEVRCMTCGEEKTFRGLRVMVAPTLPGGGRGDLIVDEAGTIKKGAFACPRCGAGNILIRRMGP